MASLASNREMEVLATLDSLAGLLEMDEEVEEGEVSLFLTTVVGLIKNSTWMRVRVAAYAALEASGKQVAGNMARRNERDYLMQVPVYFANLHRGLSWQLQPFQITFITTTPLEHFTNSLLYPHLLSEGSQSVELHLLYLCSALAHLTCSPT